MKRLKKLFKMIFYYLVVSIVLFSLAEFFYRKYIEANTVYSNAPCYQYDGTLGWVPKPGLYPEIAVSITPDGFRKTRPPGVDISDPNILAVGDSYTFCACVSDNETWPYYLSARLDVPVINAGASSYGLDQIALRLNMVIDEVKPTLVIVSVIWQDIDRRCELSYRHHHKPYFDIVDGKLIQFNNPVPSPNVKIGKKKWYDNSIIIRHLVHIRSGKGGHINESRVHHKGMQVGRRLYEFVKKLAADRGIKLMALIQVSRPALEQEDIEYMNKTEKMINSLGIPVLNLQPLMYRDYPNMADRRTLFDDHMTPKGNRWVAAKIAGFLQEHPDLISQLPITGN